MTATLYQPFFCEENITKLCTREEFGQHSMWALFITNAGRTCVCEQQRTAEPGEPTLWDYHVVALTYGAGPPEASGASATLPHGESPLDAKPPGGWWCWDFDTRLPFPAPAEDYLRQTFGGARNYPPSLWPRFRLVEREQLLALFSSDRQHMVVDSEWLKPPPPWPPILNGPPTLSRFLDLQDPIGGPWLSFGALLAFITGAPAT